MKDRSNLALALAVIAIVVVLAGVLTLGLYVRSRLSRTNTAVELLYRAVQPVAAQGLILRLNQLETAVLNVRLNRAMGVAPRDEDVQTLVNEIERIKIESDDDTPMVGQLNQWKRNMLMQLQVPPTASETERPKPEAESVPVPVQP